MKVRRISLCVCCQVLHEVGGVINVFYDFAINGNSRRVVPMHFNFAVAAVCILACVTLGNAQTPPPPPPNIAVVQLQDLSQAREAHHFPARNEFSAIVLMLMHKLS